MRFFWEVVRRAFRQETTYRLAMWAGLATNLFFGLVRAALLIALLPAGTAVNGMDSAASVTYVALTQAMIAFLRIFGMTDVSKSVYSGQVAMDLLKPTHLYTLWMGREMGKAGFNLWGRGVIFLALFAIFHPLVFPGSLGQTGWFLLSLGLSWLVSFSWNFLVNLAAFWTPDARGVARMGFLISGVLSGFYMPLQLMPEWFMRLCYWTPFPSLINTPVEIYLGIVPTGELGMRVVLQLVWFLVLAGASQAVMQLGIRKLVIQGG